MKLHILSLLVVASAATGQSTRPATLPSWPASPECAKATAELRLAESAVLKARESVLTALHSSAKYKSLAERRRLAEVALEEARSKGTPEQRIEASSAWNRARKAVEDTERDTLAGNSKMLAAQRGLAEADSAMKAAKAAYEVERKRREAEWLASDPYLAASEAERLKRIPRIRGELAQPNLRPEYRAEQEKLLREYESGVRPPPTFPSELFVGAVGYAESINIVQITGDREFLGEVYVDSSGKTAQFRFVCVRGISTAGHVDRDWLKCNMALQVTGTKRYVTTEGATNTIYVIEPYKRTPGPK